MTTQPLGRDTTSVDALIWNGQSFGDAAADSMWAQLADSLKHVALVELHAGNAPVHILFNETRGLVLLSFAAPPMTPRPSDPGIRVHTRYAHGNYCYDGTLCTYEDLRTGCFLAFDEP